MHMHRRTAAWLHKVLTLEPLAGRAAHATMEDDALAAAVLDNVGIGEAWHRTSRW